MSRFKIIDSNGNRATIVTYSSESSALSDIESWLVRNLRGGRKDINRDWLLTLRVVEEDGNHG